MDFNLHIQKDCQSLFNLEVQPHPFLELQNHILQTIKYFDIFNHPLNSIEVHNFLGVKASIIEVEKGLDQLVRDEKIFSSKDYYHLESHNDLIESRTFLNAACERVFPKAINNGNLIRRFPFVQAVFISGSLSKGVFDEENAGDFDYFIITKKNRLWISKFVLKIYKMIFLRNSKKYFCINYFISNGDLEIKEKNIFTSTELVTLIPLGNMDYAQNLLLKNEWVKGFLPNAKHQKAYIDKEESKVSKYTSFIEFIFAGKLGNMMEFSILNFAKFSNHLRYSKKHKDENYELMFRSTADQAKVHNSNHQEVVLEKFHNATATSESS